MSDLEGVLVKTASEPILVHPEARLMLEKAKEDFDSVYLWTCAEIKDAYELLKQFSLLHYFDRLIGTEDLNSNRDLMIEVIDGKFANVKYIQRRGIFKDLRLIVQDTNQIVLLEDIIRFTDQQAKLIKELTGMEINKELKNGYPEERVVYIESFKGNENHSLIKPYEIAFAKFS